MTNPTDADNEIWYTVGDFVYNESDPDECAHNYYDQTEMGELSIGERVTVEAAEFRKPKASEFAYGWAENLNERAWDQVGEAADDWIGDKASINSLQAVIDVAVDKWADENNEHPRFGVLVKEHPSIEYVITADGIERVKS